jgi:hypothetical protein
VNFVVSHANGTCRVPRKLHLNIVLDSSNLPPAVLMSTEESSFVLADGLKVYTKTWKPISPPIAQVFFLHGFSDHCNAYYTFPATLAEAEIELFSFDQRGSYYDTQVLLVTNLY